MKREIFLVIIIVALVIYLLFFNKKTEVETKEDLRIEKIQSERDSLEIQLLSNQERIDSIRLEMDSLESIISIQKDGLGIKTKELEFIRGKYRELTDDSLRSLMIDEYRKKNNE